MLDILKENGFNWIRLRLFVDPTAEHGYSREGFCGLEQTIAMANTDKSCRNEIPARFSLQRYLGGSGKTIHLRLLGTIQRIGT